ncbi:hypothetical protein [Oceanobacter mangrovi]|uniref:hypothetical protein n=1 Tax=Oceanobacter mangrovi TaxID=2862510 RepID=UPI001C8DB153|nr:hypothetical protein [Oceanobacter mangrovi]
MALAAVVITLMTSACSSPGHSSEGEEPVTAKTDTAQPVKTTTLFYQGHGESRSVTTAD